MQDVADKKKLISDEDLLALVTDEVHQAQVIYELIDLQANPPPPPPPPGRRVRLAPPFVASISLAFTVSQ